MQNDSEYFLNIILLLQHASLSSEPEVSTSTKNSDDQSPFYKPVISVVQPP